MTTPDYAACVRELYEGEIVGEAMALALIDASRDDRDRHAFGTLLQLETETKARLRPFLARHGLPLKETANLDDVDLVVGAYRATGSFREFASAIRPVAEKYLARIEQIARSGPAEDREVLDSMVRHEAAIVKWFVMESEGKSQGSLHDMMEQLRYPLPCA
ncbi:MAG: hypothetical protein ACREUE_13340 [Panacagrimonas sp.]